MKQGKIAIYIILFYIGTIIYEVLFPAFPPIHKSWFYVILRILFFLLMYGVLFAVALDDFKKTTHKPDSLALFTLMIYSAGKFIYYMFITNYDMPTYISACNSKEISIFVSIVLWIFSWIIWYKRFKIKKIFNQKSKRYDRRS